MDPLAVPRGEDKHRQDKKITGQNWKMLTQFCTYSGIATVEMQLYTDTRINPLQHKQSGISVAKS